MRGTAAALLLSAALAGCAVKGYELGWRDADRIAPLLGRPLDPLAGCRHREGGTTARPARPACDGLIDAVGALAAALPPVEAAPEALGARCRASVCTYANVYERRDVGLALVLPVFRKIVLREARGRFVLRDGAWQLADFAVLDLPPPSYGPVRIGGSPGGS